MKNKGWIGIGLMTVLLSLGSLHYAHATSLAIEGNPLEIRSNEVGTIGVYRWQNDILVRQYFGYDDGIGTALFLNGTEFVFRARGSTHDNHDSYPTFTPISNSMPDPWTIQTVLAAGTTGVKVTLTISYTNGSAYYRKVWKITNTGTTPYHDLKLLHGGDTYFAGDDRSEGHWDSSLGMVFLTNPDPSITGIMGFYGGQGSPANNYYESYYTNVWAAISSGNLPNTVQADYHDAGYALKWDRSALAPGETWTIEAYEKWTEAGYVQVIAPADQKGNPGDTMNYLFVVKNYETVQDSFDLLLESSNGWPIDLPDGDVVTIPAMGSATVKAQVTIPSTATPGTTDELTLKATSQSNSSITNSDSVTTTVYTSIVVGPYTVVADVNGDGKIDVKDYHLIAVPGVLVPDNPDALTIFGGPGAVYDESQLVILRYDPTTRLYKSYPDVPPVSPDKGYWFITRKDRQVQVKGKPVPTNNPFAVSLSPGWNMVGYPFMQQCAWGNVQVRVGSSVYPIGDTSNIWVDHQAWGYLKEYLPVDVETGVCKPWDGYWVRNKSTQNVEILFPIPVPPTLPIQTKVVTSGVPTATVLNTRGKGISFALEDRSTGYRDSTLLLGLHRNAATGYDPMDCMSPPRISGDAPRIYANHYDWKVGSGAYAVDMQPLGKYPTAFKLTMEVPKRPLPTSYFLSWKGISAIPSSLKVVLVDQEKVLSVNMRSKSGYTIVVPKDRTRYDLKVVLRQ